VTRHHCEWYLLNQPGTLFDCQIPGFIYTFYFMYAVAFSGFLYDDQTSCKNSTVQWAAQSC